MNAPACRTCVVDPERDIDEHAWLVDAVRTAWVKARPTESYQAMATRIAAEFNSHFDPKIYKLKKAGKGTRLETDAERDGRVFDRVTKIFNWITNHRSYFDQLKNGIPRILDLPEVQAQTVAVPRGKSIMDLFKHDYPEVGQKARQAAGSDAGDQQTEVNLAYSAALAELQATNPEKVLAYEQESKRSKEEASVARAQAKAAPTSVDTAWEGEDTTSKADNLKRVLYSAKVSVDTWAKTADAQYFLYIGVVEDGQCVKYLIGNNASSPDSLVAQMKTNPLLDELDELVLLRKQQQLASVAEAPGDPHMVDEEDTEPASSAAPPAPVHEPSVADAGQPAPAMPPLVSGAPATHSGDVNVVTEVSVVGGSLAAPAMRQPVSDAPAACSGDVSVVTEVSVAGGSLAAPAMPPPVSDAPAAPNGDVSVVTEVSVAGGSLAAPAMTPPVSDAPAAPNGDVSVATEVPVAGGSLAAPAMPPPGSDSPPTRSGNVSDVPDVAVTGSGLADSVDGPLGEVSVAAEGSVVGGGHDDPPPSQTEDEHASPVVRQQSKKTKKGTVPAKRGRKGPQVDAATATTASGQTTMRGRKRKGDDSTSEAATSSTRPKRAKRKDYAAMERGENDLDTNNAFDLLLKNFVRQLSLPEVHQPVCPHNPKRQLQYRQNNANDGRWYALCTVSSCPKAKRVQYLSDSLGADEHALIARMREVVDRLRVARTALKRLGKRRTTGGDGTGVHDDQVKHHADEERHAQAERARLDREARELCERRDAPSQTQDGQTGEAQHNDRIEARPRHSPGRPLRKPALPRDIIELSDSSAEESDNSASYWRAVDDPSSPSERPRAHTVIRRPQPSSSGAAAQTPTRKCRAINTEDVIDLTGDTSDEDEALKRPSGGASSQAAPPASSPIRPSSPVEFDPSQSSASPEIDDDMPEPHLFDLNVREVSFTRICTASGLELMDPVAVWLSTDQKWRYMHVENLADVRFQLHGGDTVVWAQWGLEELPTLDWITNDDATESPEWPDATRIWEAREARYSV
ncbi:uncharacterized protein B0H18DRAFT_1113642 [Fomitopsis serialis]|uniref:uncharacterized protein n=1 Tax=Fomitopsis serialis TaxID=139415 RepID=UPI00200774B4|nr:uncharacterized protein B0H18DRAFT_1113642 [Neoantrodia serialis]KAH9936212.1 hypothetical protein B0H18DRAFT_1113642 [Neoantrodia serialis]